VRYESTTGLDAAQMTELVARIFQVEAGRPWDERGRFQMGLRDQVRLTLTLLRTESPWL